MTGAQHRTRPAHDGACDLRGGACVDARLTGDGQAERTRGGRADRRTHRHPPGADAARCSKRRWATDADGRGLGGARAGAGLTMRPTGLSHREGAK